jgi:hypothetical protein
MTREEAFQILHDASWVCHDAGWDFCAYKCEDAKLWSEYWPVEEFRRWAREERARARVVAPILPPHEIRVRYFIAAVFDAIEA